MPVVKLMGRGQITIPKKIRDSLALKEGDFVDVAIERNRVVLTPKQLVRQEALKRLDALLDEIHAQNPDVSEEEVVKDALKAIDELRQEEYARKETA